MKANQIICGNALDVLRELPQNSINMSVTSPPYYGLRDYGVDGQIGVEESPQKYIDRLVSVFREIKRILCDDGTLWVNIADSYAGSGKGVWNKPLCDRENCKQIYYVSEKNETATMPNLWEGIKPKDMIGIPWMLAFALRADGWYLRSDIIWQKTNAMPENVHDRPSKSYEHLFLLSKSAKYYYDDKAIMEPLAECTVERYKRGRSDKAKYSDYPTHQQINKGNVRFSDLHQKYRNKRDVWSIATNAYRMDKHFAMYPEKLIEPCILAGCPADGIVLDPFFGSGTTGAVAKRLGRSYIGIDLNSEYCEAAEKRLERTVG